MVKYLPYLILTTALTGLFAVIAIDAPSTANRAPSIAANQSDSVLVETIVPVPEVKAANTAVSKSVPLPKNPECKSGEDTFSCYDRFYKELTSGGGVLLAMGDMKKRYATNSFVSSQCHQLVHVVGREVGREAKSIGEAFVKGDSFCWSGYYHGVVEAFIQKGGKQVLAEGEGLNSICQPLREARAYSFDHYNCAHGLGHGIMAVKYNELFDSLKVCDLLTDQWDRSSCWGGIYMENIMVDEKVHKTKYLKPNDLLYPCNAVDNAYQPQCYLMQTSYMLKLSGYDFSKVFDLCDKVGGANEMICYQSLGRDASGQSISDPVRTKDTCLLGKTKEQRENCVIGAVKDFISYFHSDVRAREFCAMLPDTLPETCFSTAESYYDFLIGR